MSANALVHLTVQDDGIAVLHMQDANGQNTFREEFLDQLLDRLARVSADEAVRVCVVRGLDDVFCAGAAKEMLAELANGKMEASDITLPGVLLDVPIPLIAAMEGHAIGGGLALGLCCDIVLMAKESRYGASFMNMGFTPGMMTTRLIAGAAGDYLAAEVLYGGENIKGAHFEGRGNINYVLPKDKVLKKAMRVAQRVAEKPRYALETLKRYMSLPRRKLFQETRTVETLMHQVTFSRPETIARIQKEYAPSLKGNP